MIVTTTKYLTKLKKYYDRQEGQDYPCSNQIVTNIFYINEFDDKIIEYVEYIGGIWHGKNKWHKAIVVGDNRYILLKPSDKTRGYRAYKAIIDNRIPIDDIQLFIEPYLELYCCHIDIAYLRGW